jgi:hypothetical protein
MTLKVISQVKEKCMSLKNKKLVAILGGRPYMDNITLKKVFNTTCKREA